MESPSVEPSVDSGRSYTPPDPSEGRHYAYIDPHQIGRVEIFPPIGVARVGDSGADEKGEPHHEIEYFYGPEVPGVTDVPVSNFRDRKEGIKRQAVRFRVYAYDKNGNLLGEINREQRYILNWKVHVANKKAAYYCFSGLHHPRNTDLRNPDVDADRELDGNPLDKSLEGRKSLIIDPGEKSIAYVSHTQPRPVQLQGTFQGSASRPIPVTLGELRTDSAGRLVFMGGSGVARSVQGPGTAQLFQPEIISEFDSIDWIDSICDGWVDVKVSHPARPILYTEIPRPHKATVLSAPPKFAWGLSSPTTLYDIIENIYKEKSTYVGPKNTEFERDIWPVLFDTYKLAWVNSKALQGHGPGGYADFVHMKNKLENPRGDHVLREQIFGRLRRPNYEDKTQAHVIFMPRLSGDSGDAVEPGTIRASRRPPIERFAALTKLQYERFEDWKNGNFETGVPLPADKKAIEDFPVKDQPGLLTRAMLEQCIGDPLYPGLEMYWLAKLPEVYRLGRVDTHLNPPFRVNHDAVLPGFLSRGLSLPWQSDFDLCSTHWWPSARPDDVFVIPGHNMDKDSARDPWISGDNPQFASWTRGLRETPENTLSSFFPGSTDMVKLWTYLGFVKKFGNASALGDVPTLQAVNNVNVNAYNVWVERERRLIPVPKSTE
ncbi:hypothetical protein C8Q78DRAFT_1097533 [Trametes maxima]|nr:hypothetical protein C8Q78DRAFT_1097533 [Trametes maxima]